MQYPTRKALMNFTALFLMLLGNSACTNLLFQPVRHVVPIPKKYNIEYHDFYVETIDGLKLHGWYLPANPRDGRKKKHKSVLLLHGNAVNIGSHVAAIAWLPQYGYDAYIFDYRGYGNSQGIQDLYGSFLDIDATVNYVVGRLHPDEKFIIIGQSLGAAMGIYALNYNDYKSRISAYICISAFSDYRQITRDFLSRNWFTWLFQWPLSLTINNDYSPLKFISQLSPIPIYFLHGINDEVVPLYHTQRLFEAASKPKFMEVLKKGHNDFFLSAGNRKHILSILDKI